VVGSDISPPWMRGGFLIITIVGSIGVNFVFCQPEFPPRLSSSLLPPL